MEKQMSNSKYHWQIKDSADRVIVDHVSHAIALEMLTILQHHNKQVTLRLVDGDAQ
jgi:Pyruvate/2-oxoacid:ferredoxin oxidoreductase gamma subunit